jgi:cold shock CspA family protein
MMYLVGIALPEKTVGTIPCVNDHKGFPHPMMHHNNNQMDASISMCAIGQVKWFSEKLGYGFITVINTGPENGNDYFAHHSEIYPKRSIFKMLTKGEYVSFTIKPSANGGKQAANVTGVFGHSLLVDHVYRPPPARNHSVVNEPPPPPYRNFAIHPDFSA